MSDHKIVKTLLLVVLFTFSLRLAARTVPAGDSVSPPVTVYVFLSETCPICQSYTVKLKELYQLYHEKNVRIIGVFPNYYSSQENIGAFRKKYKIPFELVLDPGNELTKRLGATITPETFVENSMGQVLYSGRIDDSYYQIGKRRNVITSHDLLDALNSILQNKLAAPLKTQAVGCMISLSK